MAITNIQVNFTPCVPAPVGGYNIVYRVVGDLSYIDAGNFMASPANIGVSYPDGTLFEGIVHSPCGDVVWSTVPVTTDGCGCRFGYPGEDELAGENRQFDVTSAYTFVFTGSSAITLQVNNSNGIPIYGLSSGGSGAVVGENTSNSTGVAGYAVSGTGVYAQSSSGFGLWALTTTGTAAGLFGVNPATVDTIQNVVRLNRNTSGTAADGIGGSIEYYTEDDSGSLQLSTQLVSDWLTAAAGTRRSEFYITGVDNAVTQTLFMLSGTGQGRLNNYGVGTFLDTPVYAAGFLADGTIIEYDPTTIGGSGVSMFRFGFGGEDDTAGENRLFDVGIYTFTFQTTEVGGGALNLNAPNGVGLTSIGSMAGGLFDGNAGVGIQSESNSGDYGVDARSYIATDNTLVYPAIKCLSIAGILPTDVGFGTGINFEITTDTLPHSRNSNRIVSRWNNATEGLQRSEFYIAGVDNATDAILLSILGNGIFTLPLGLFEYADDTAAAAGTPPIPIGGLYRIGNTPQIRLT